MNSETIAKYIIQNKDNLNVDVLFSYLKKYRLEYLLPSVLKNLKSKTRMEENRNKNKLVSPHTLDTDNKKSLEDKYNIKIDQEEIDKNIVTGYKLYTRDKIVDASLDTLLKNFIKAN